VTEAVAFYFRKDESLLLQYLQSLGIEIKSINKVEIATQLPIAVGRIDVSISWKSENVRHTLFLENKIWSAPWKSDDEYGDPIDQVRTYCNFQKLNGDKRYVALISNFPVPGFERGDLPEFDGCYLGNFLWKDLAKLVKAHTGRLGSDSFSYHYGSELYEFFRRHSMTGFENFSGSELAAIKYLKSYDAKIEQLAISVQQYFQNVETPAAGFKPGFHDEVDFCMVMAVYHNEDARNPGDADRWVCAGIADADGEWFVAPLLENIPDVICGVALWFGDEDDRDSFMEELGIRHGMHIGDFEVDSNADRDGSLFIVKRLSLNAFLNEDNQEKAIIEYLGAGIDAIATDKEMQNILAKALVCMGK